MCPAGLNQNAALPRKPGSKLLAGVDSGLPSHGWLSEGKPAHENARESTKSRSLLGHYENAKLDSETEAFVESPDNDAEDSVVPEERSALLQWKKRQQIARWIAAGRFRNADADEDPPPDPAEERLLDRLSAPVVAEEPPIDFGYDLHLSVQEREYMDSRVKEELAKIQRASQDSPSLEGLLFAETFDSPDVFDSWVMSASYTHPGRWLHRLRLPEAIEGDHGIMTASPGFRHAISTLLPTTVRLSSRRPLVLQYELQQQQPDFRCGGGHLTFFTADAPSHCHFDESTAYALRRILALKAEQHAYTALLSIQHSLHPRLPLPFSEKSRLFTLIIKPEGSFTILLDGRMVRKEIVTEFPSFNAVGLAFMAMDSGTLVDNIIVSDDIAAVQRFSRATFWVGSAGTLVFPILCVQ
ncbi:calnexin, putative [Eimeria praecox]|uniref:Calnexin, putative n=1 Tax=Eimeria praecox TaxID=51316 RepID=U6GYF1_9EIME|nr:calnexin, putative [Eimeria praecox]